MYKPKDMDSGVGRTPVISFTGRHVIYRMDIVSIDSERLILRIDERGEIYVSLPTRV